MKRSLVIFLHAGYWLAYLMLAGIILVAIDQSSSIIGEAKTFYYPGIILGIAIIPAVFSFYIFYFFLFPRYLQKRKIPEAIISGIIVSLLSFLLAATTLRFSANIGWTCYGETNYVAILIVSFISFMHGVVAYILRGFITWYQEIKIKEELQKKNHEMELSSIKSQLDPHFLFNTLNNIDILIIKDPEQASDYLNKLSDIMRFMLFETKTKHIPLEKELAYIRKYVDLQKIRTANDRFVNFKISGHPATKKIAPLVFIPFIENAFKHTNNKKLEDAINIDFNINGASVRMLCTNKVDPTRNSVVESNGLGHELIIKRLHLLYPDSHKLEIKEEKNTYQVLLKIDYEKI